MTIEDNSPLDEGSWDDFGDAVKVNLGRIRHSYSPEKVGIFIVPARHGNIFDAILLTERIHIEIY
jgi:predicted molibdopterin-dependent oxidoreductase YjgC